ncbi:hypothetical protein ABZ468_05225 [Streptomyces sp. NPDC005708]|uniref:hypothetical protein n=1 Tax=Streptomyces sp. NPDC005708 TaxID=3154564 RepID=UPI0033D19996
MIFALPYAIADRVDGGTSGRTSYVPETSPGRTTFTTGCGHPRHITYDVTRTTSLVTATST